MKKIFLTVAMASAMLSGHAQHQTIQNCYAEFAFSLFEQIEAQNTGNNIVVSPLSAQIGLTILLNGAQGESLDEIKRVLKVEDYELDELNTYNKDVMTKIANNPLPDNVQKYFDSMGITPAEGSIPVVEYANSIWSRMLLKDQFVGVNESLYGTTIKTVDFTKPETWNEIDEWVAEKTYGHIKGLDLERNPEAAMILSNVLYFAASWHESYKFSEELTMDKAFYNADGTIVDVPMMNYGDIYTAGIEHEEGKIFRIPLGYDTNKLSMTFFMPTKHGKYSNDIWKCASDMRKYEDGHVYLPRFDVEDEQILNNTLSNMGLKQALSNNADFSAISDESFVLEQIKQKAHIGIDEVGVIASAATSLDWSSAHLPKHYIDLTFDHPFYFSIEDNTTGTILFLGKINNLKGPLSQVATSTNDIIISNATPAYTLDGRKADGYSKGIVIKDGKKMIR